MVAEIKSGFFVPLLRIKDSLLVEDVKRSDFSLLTDLMSHVLTPIDPDNFAKSGKKWWKFLKLNIFTTMHFW